MIYKCVIGALYSFLKPFTPTISTFLIYSHFLLHITQEVDDQKVDRRFHHGNHRRHETSNNIMVFQFPIDFVEIITAERFNKHTLQQVVFALSLLFVYILHNSERLTSQSLTRAESISELWASFELFRVSVHLIGG